MKITIFNNKLVKEVIIMVSQLISLLAASTIGSIIINQTKIDDKKLHDAAVTITAEALTIKDSVEKEFNKIIKEAESKK